MTTKHLKNLYLILTILQVYALCPGIRASGGDGGSIDNDGNSSRGHAATRRARILLVVDNTDLLTGLCADRQQSGSLLHDALSDLSSLAGAAGGNDSVFDLTVLEGRCDHKPDTELLSRVGEELTTSVAGVITLTSQSNSQPLVDAMVIFPDVPVVELLPAGVGMKSRKSSRSGHYLVAHFAESLIMDGVLAAKLLNWSAVSVVTPQPEAGVTAFKFYSELFQVRANQQGICITRPVTPASTADDKSGLPDKPESVSEDSSKGGDSNEMLYPAVIPYPTAIHDGQSSGSGTRVISQMKVPVLLIYPDFDTQTDVLSSFEQDKNDNVLYLRLKRDLMSKIETALRIRCNTSDSCHVYSSMTKELKSEEVLTFENLIGAISFLLNRENSPTAKGADTGPESPKSICSTREHSTMACLLASLSERVSISDSNWLTFYRDDGELVNFNQRTISTAARFFVPHGKHQLHLYLNKTDAVECSPLCQSTCRRCFIEDDTAVTSSHNDSDEPCSETESKTKTPPAAVFLPRWFWPDKGVFVDEAWAVAVLTLAVLGAGVTWGCILYVAHKVCTGALGSRSVALGLLLLVSVSALFLSAVPYVVSPSHVVCGLRLLLPGVSYVMCFGVILAKLMAIQGHRLVGLGGDVSRGNLYVTLVLAVGVQVVIATLWWVYRGSDLVSQTGLSTYHGHHDYRTLLHADRELQSGSAAWNSTGSQVMHHACQVGRRSFALYHIYAGLLLILCLAYAWVNRRETRNSREALIMLLACSSCLVVWVTWLPLFLSLTRKWCDVVVCAGILGCAASLLVIVFAPKIKIVSKLRYSVTSSDKGDNLYHPSSRSGVADPYIIGGRGGAAGVRNLGYDATADDDEMDYIPEMFQMKPQSFGSNTASYAVQQGETEYNRQSLPSHYNSELTNY